MLGRGQTGLPKVNGKRTEYLAGGIKDRRGPAGLQPVRVREVNLCERVRLSARRCAVLAIGPEAHHLPIVEATLPRETVDQLASGRPFRSARSATNPNSSSIPLECGDSSPL